MQKNGRWSINTELLGEPSKLNAIEFETQGTNLRTTRWEWEVLKLKAQLNSTVKKTSKINDFMIQILYL